MRAKASILMILTLALVAASLAIPAMANPRTSREDKIKAAFLYNFINFVDWPKEGVADSNQPITIGVIGSRDFFKALEPLAQKKIKGRKILLKLFPDYAKLKKTRISEDRRWSKKIEMLKALDALLLCTCDSEPIEDAGSIVNALRDSPVLTVGETNGFLESGGIINFLMKDEKVRFEINNTVARKSGLKIRSKLLRLADRVVGERASNGAGN